VCASPPRREHENGAGTTRLSTRGPLKIECPSSPVGCQLSNPLVEARIAAKGSSSRGEDGRDGSSSGELPPSPPTRIPYLVKIPICRLITPRGLESSDQDRAIRTNKEGFWGARVLEVRACFPPFSYFPGHSKLVGYPRSLSDQPKRGNDVSGPSRGFSCW
jgi:hypothetical protein